MGRSRKPPRPRKPCIFCGDSNKRLTEEHIFPDWLRKEFPGQPDSTHVSIWQEKNPFAFLAEHPNRVSARRLHEFKNGAVRSISVRCVCDVCNNVWMSDLETKAKPLLSEVMRDTALILGTSEQQLLCRWAVLKSMVLDARPSLRESRWDLVVQQAERDAFRESLTVSDRWSVWIGRSHVDAGTHALFPVRGLLSGSRIPKLPSLTPNTNDPHISHNTNVQSISFLFGRLLIYTQYFGFPPTGPCGFVGQLARLLVPIAPLRTDSIVWPLPLSFTLKDLDSLDTVWTRPLVEPPSS